MCKVWFIPAKSKTKIQRWHQMVVHVLNQHQDSAWSDLILKGFHPSTESHRLNKYQKSNRSSRMYSHTDLHPISHKRPCNAIVEQRCAVPFGSVYTVRVYRWRRSTWKATQTEPQNVMLTIKRQNRRLLDQAKTNNKQTRSSAQVLVIVITSKDHILWI